MKIVITNGEVSASFNCEIGKPFSQKQMRRVGRIFKHWVCEDVWVVDNDRLCISTVIVPIKTGATLRHAWVIEDAG